MPTQSLINLALIFIVSGIAACGKTTAPTGANSATALIMNASSEDFYAKLRAIPQAGATSLAATYSHIGTMSFTQYFKELAANAPDVSMVVDGFAIGNPKQALAAREGAFTALGLLFPTVEDWWQATNSRPQPAASYTEYKADLFAGISKQFSLGDPNDRNLAGVSVSALLGTYLWQWVQGRTAAPLRRWTLTDELREADSYDIIAARVRRMSNRDLGALLASLPAEPTDMATNLVLCAAMVSQHNRQPAGEGSSTDTPQDPTDASASGGASGSGASGSGASGSCPNPQSQPGD